MKFDTKVVRAGISPDPTTGSIVPPIYATATYVLDEVGKDKGFDYTRSTNPTRQVLEANLAAIEGGAHGVCYASGTMAPVVGSGVIPARTTLVLNFIGLSEVTGRLL